MKVKLESRGGGCYGGNRVSPNPMRLFAVIRDDKGKKIAETEVDIIDGIVTLKKSKEDV